MDKKKLLDNLTTVAPALSSNDLIQSLSHFWFTGKQLMAYNDQISISLPMKTEFMGAAPGSLMIQLLNATSDKTKDVELEPIEDKDESVLLMKAGAAKIKIPMMTADEAFIFTMPKGANGPTFEPNEKFLKAISACLKSVSSDTSVADQLGVTIICDGGKVLSLYATNDASLTHAEVEIAEKLPKLRLILPTSFCEQMLSLAKGATNTSLLLQEDHALFKADDKTLFGRLINSPAPLDFVSIIKRHNADGKRKLMDVPERLPLLLQRIIIMTESQSKVDQSPVQISVKGDGFMDFYAKSQRGEVRDRLKVTEAQPKVELRVDPRPLKIGVDWMKQYVATPDCIIMKNEVATYLVSINQ